MSKHFFSTEDPAAEEDPAECPTDDEAPEGPMDEAHGGETT